jgi:hypothetical protein
MSAQEVANDTSTTNDTTNDTTETSNATNVAEPTARSQEQLSGQTVIVIGDHVYRKRKRKVSSDDSFVKSADYLLKTLKDMHEREEAFLFRNRSEVLTCMLRSTSEATDELMTFDLVVVHDPAKDMHDAFKKVMEMEYTVIPDDEGDYIIDTLTVSKDATSDDMTDALESINLLYEMDVCECYENLVKSPALGLCYQCSIMKDPLDEPTDACVICADLIQTTRGGVSLNCCGQRMHKKCYQRWRSEEETRVCPICRK